MDASLRRLLIAQRRRAVASIMGYAEREVYASLAPDKQRALRDKVLSSIDAYHDLMLDILGAAHDPDEMISAEAIEILRELRDRLPQRTEV